MMVLHMMGAVGDWDNEMMAGGFGGVHYGLGLISWVVFMAFLVAATRYLWKKGGEQKK